MSPSQAAIGIGASDSAGRKWVINAGGVMERASVMAGYRLSYAHRCSIENGCREGFTFSAIATLIGKAVSTISREVGENGGRDRYRADLAQLGAEDRARRPKATKLETNPVLRDRVEAGLDAVDRLFSGNNSALQGEFAYRPWFATASAAAAAASGSR